MFRLAVQLAVQAPNRKLLPFSGVKKTNRKNLWENRSWVSGEQSWNHPMSVCLCILGGLNHTANNINCKIIPFSIETKTFFVPSCKVEQCNNRLWVGTDSVLEPPSSGHEWNCSFRLNFVAPGVAAQCKVQFKLTGAEEMQRQFFLSGKSLNFFFT